MTRVLFLLAALLLAAVPLFAVKSVRDGGHHQHHHHYRHHYGHHHHHNQDAATIMEQHQQQEQQGVEVQQRHEHHNHHGHEHQHHEPMTVAAARVKAIRKNRMEQRAQRKAAWQKKKAKHGGVPHRWRRHAEKVRRRRQAAAAAQAKQRLQARPVHHHVSKKTKVRRHKFAAKRKALVMARQKEHARSATRRILDRWRRNMVKGAGSLMRRYDLEASEHFHHRKRHPNDPTAPCSLPKAGGFLAAPTEKKSTALVETGDPEDPTYGYRGLWYCRQCLCDLGLGAHDQCTFALESVSWDNMPFGKLDYLAKCIEDVPGCDCKACEEQWSGEDYPKKEGLKCDQACKKSGEQEIIDGEEPPPPCSKDELEDMHKPPTPLDVWKVHLGHNVAVKYAKESCEKAEKEKPKEMEDWLEGKLNCAMAALGPGRAYYCACEEGDDKACSEKDSEAGKGILAEFEEAGGPSPADQIAGIAPKGAGWFCSPPGKFGAMGHGLFDDLEPMLGEIIPPMIEEFAIEMLHEMEKMPPEEANDFVEGLTPMEKEQLALEALEEEEAETDELDALFEDEFSNYYDELEEGLIDPDELEQVVDDAEDLEDSSSLEEDKKVVHELKETVDSMEEAAKEEKLEGAEQSLDGAGDSLAKAEEVLDQIDEEETPPGIGKEVAKIAEDLEAVEQQSEEEHLEEVTPKLAEKMADGIVETFDGHPKDGKLNDLEFEMSKEFVEEEKGENKVADNLGAAYAPVVVDKDGDDQVEKEELVDALEPAVEKALKHEEEE